MTIESRSVLSTAWANLVRQLAASLPGSNFWKCMRAGAQAIADARTPGMAAGEVDDLASIMVRSINPETPNQVTGKFFNSADPPITAVGALGTVVLPGGGGGCVPADLFTDVFDATSGPIPACPGSLDGWCQYGGGGSAELSGSSLRPLGTARVQKPTGSILPAVDISGRFEFIESAGETGIGDFSYNQGFVNDGFGPQAETIIGLLDDGTALIAGPGISLAGGAGIGVWSPQPGGHRIADWSISPAGVPSLFVDGVAIPLAPAGLVTAIKDPNLTTLETDNAGQTDSMYLGSWLTSGSAAPPPLDCGYCS